MKKLVIVVTLTAVIAGFFGLIQDNRTLKKELIRIHVVAQSDTQEDQAVKLQVKDAILRYVRQGMEEAKNAGEAKAFLKAHIEELEKVANAVLEDAGFSQTAVISLKQEDFPVREYDTFTLPSGVYESLRVVIGEGRGHNWWCVVFPELCLPKTSDEVEAVSASSGFSQSLADTLTHKEDYEVRFFFLDLIGKIEKLLHRG